ncbi:MAG: amidase [Candidatus Dormibacterales bacterium]
MTNPGLDPAWSSAAELAPAVRGGELDPQSAVRVHLERITRLDRDLRAYVHVDAGARAAGTGELAGTTLAVKDTQPVAGMPWTLGSVRWKDRTAVRDSLPVALARRAGAAVLGKTNTPELAGSSGTANELFGATQNPWRPGVTPGGSSGGSAAAVAAGLATIAVGDDYGGSVRIPASCCGVAGLRPTPGRIDDEDWDPGGLNSRGPLARTVADLRLGLAALTGEVPPPPEGSRARRIGVVLESPLPAAPECLEACRRAAAALAAAGHEVENLPWEPEPVAVAYAVLRRASLARVPGSPAEYGNAVRRLIAEGRSITVGELRQAYRTAAGVSAVTVGDPLSDRFEAILTPTLGRLPMPIGEVPAFLGEAWRTYIQFLLPASFARTPALSLPAGSADGLPVGVQLIGRVREEWALLDLAQELERAAGFGFVRPPALE